MKKLTREDFEGASGAAKKQSGNWIKVGMSTCGVAAGADTVFNTLAEESRRRNIQIEIKKCGCLGMCYAEPLVEVCVEGLPTARLTRRPRSRYLISTSAEGSWSTTISTTSRRESRVRAYD